MTNELDDQAINRLFQHLLHEEDLFTNHHNFFLVLESALLGTTGFILTASQSNLTTGLIFASLGFILNLVWLYTMVRMQWMLGLLRKRLRKHLPEYNQTMEERERTRWPISTSRLLTWFVPCITLLVWLAIAIFQLH